MIAELPDRQQVEVDKDDRYWYLIYTREDVDLRLRISHIGDQDPDKCEGAARLKGATEFVHVGTFWCAPIEHSAEWPDRPSVNEFPDCWRAEFLMLIRLWSALTDLTQVAFAPGTSWTVGVH